MAQFRFVQQPRKKNSNEPLTYTIREADGKEAGTLKRQKNRWRLHWRGIAADFDTRIQLQRHFSLLGHKIEGLA